MRIKIHDRCLCAICVWLLCRDVETGVYKLTVGEEQEMVLRAVVYNSGEEAHRATLSIALPPNLHYVGTDTQVLKFSIFLQIVYFHCDTESLNHHLKAGNVNSQLNKTKKYKIILLVQNWTECCFINNMDKAVLTEL